MSGLCHVLEECSECYPDEPWKLKKAEQMAATKDVHSTSFISECDVQILCTSAWTFPYTVLADSDVLYSQDAISYTKEKSKVTCAGCLKKMKV